MLRQLLWKDYRLNRSLLGLTGAIMLVLYGIGAITQIHATWPAMPPAREWGGMLVSYGSVALFVTILVSALLGGNAIACERADRSAHFLAYLPPTKIEILISKLIVVVSANLILWGWVLLSVRIIAPWLTSERVGFGGTMSAGYTASICLLTFGVGWLGSAYLQTPVFPVVLALCSPFAVGMGLVMVCDALRIPRFQAASYAGPTCFWTGLVAFAVGTWGYFRRVEP